MRLSPGAMVDRYLVEGLLGEGGMAAVYQVRHRLLGTRHALKVLTLSADEPRARLLLEGQVQARLEHPHLLPVQGILQLGDHPALLMPLVEGPSLRTLLQHHAPAQDAALALLRACAEGLAAAHAQGVIHRDLKPDNILLALRLGRVQPRIADFGLVKALDGGADEGLRTRTGMVLGTPAYAAPEQLRDARQADARADLFSLGVLGVELLCGRRPFAGRSLPEIVEAHLRPPEIPGLEAGLTDLLAALLARDPADRPASVAAVLARLPQPEGEPLGARSPLFQAALALQHSVRPRAAAVTLLDELDDGSIATDALLAPSHLEQAPRPPLGRLPAERTSCTGRTAEQAELTRLLAAGRRLVTVIGAGGIGKTRLAVRVGHATRVSWPGGVWLCELADVRDEAGILGAVRAVLEVPPDQPVPDALRDRPPLLLILDNLEQLLEPAREVLSVWLEAAPALSVLVTSRAPLRLAGEEVVSLEPLAIADAAALFVERAHAAGRRGLVADAEVAALAEQLDGLPLAIELAAAWACVLSPAQLLARLQAPAPEQAERVLTSRGGGRPDRQRTLRATLEWSWALLQPAQQRALAQCAVFSGGFTLEAAEAVLVADDPADWPEALLAELVDRSLLVRSEGRHTGAPRLRMLHSIQRLAAEHLGTARAAAEQRHGAFFAGLGTADALERLRQHGGTAAQQALLDEADNLWAAARRAIARGDADLAVPCAGAVAHICGVQGPLEAGAALQQAAAQLPLRPAQRAAVLLWEAGLSLSLPSARPVLPLLEEAAALFEQSGDPVGGLQVQIRQAQHTHHARARLDEAHHGYRAALQAARAIGHRRLEGELHLLCAELAVQRALLPEAVAEARAALAILQAVGDRDAEGRALSCLSYAWRLQGATDEALRTARRALRIQQELGSVRGAAATLCRIGQMLHDQGHYADALVPLEEARRACEEIGDIALLSRVIGRLVHLHRDRGSPEAAQDLLAVEQALGRRQGILAQEANALNNLAGLAHDAGQYEVSIAHLREALVLYTAAGDPRRAATVHNNLGSALAMLGRLEEAEQHVRSALSALPPGQIPAYEVPFRATLADILSRRGQTEAALAALDAGAALLHAAPSAPLQVMLLTSRARILLRADAVAEARAACAEAASLLATLHGGPQAFLKRELEAVQATLPAP